MLEGVGDEERPCSIKLVTRRVVVPEAWWNPDEDRSVASVVQLNVS